MSQAPPSKSDDITIFVQHCVFTFSVYLHGKTLFEHSGSADKDRMSRTANTFFGDINRVLNEYVILQICKITDPARDRKGQNHTVAFLLERYQLNDPATCSRLIELEKSINAFREKLLPARNKRIAHADRDAAFSPEPLGGAPEEDWEQFWTDLDELISLLHEAVTNEPLHIREVGMLSDADELLKALKAADCFEQLLRDGDAALTHKCADLFFRE